MTLRAAGGRSIAESVEDLAQWVRDLDNCPTVMRTEVAACHRPAHGDEPSTWFYVEADSRAGVARLRCLACGHAKALFDSEERWTYPAVLSCQSCSTSIGEVVYGLHVEDGCVTWVAVAMRCVECGDMRGATDFVLAPTMLDEVLAQLR